MDITILDIWWNVTKTSPVVKLAMVRISFPQTNLQVVFRESRRTSISPRPSQLLLEAISHNNFCILITNISAQLLGGESHDLRNDWRHLEVLVPCVWRLRLIYSRILINKLIIYVLNICSQDTGALLRGTFPSDPCAVIMFIYQTWMDFPGETKVLYKTKLKKIKNHDLIDSPTGSFDFCYQRLLRPNNKTSCLLLLSRAVNWLNT